MGRTFGKQPGSQEVQGKSIAVAYMLWLFAVNVCIFYCCCHCGCHQNPASLAFQCELKTSSSPGMLQAISTRLELLGHLSFQPPRCTDSHCWNTSSLSCKPISYVLVRIVLRNGTDLRMSSLGRRKDTFPSVGE